jgi:hypothetical protein
MKVSEILENADFHRMKNNPEFRSWYTDFKKFANHVYGKDVMLTSEEMDKMMTAYDKGYDPLQTLDFVMRNIDPETDDDYYDDSMRSAEMGHQERKEAQRWEREKGRL